MKRKLPMLNGKFQRNDPEPREPNYVTTCRGCSKDILDNMTWFACERKYHFYDLGYVYLCMDCAVASGLSW